MNCWHTGVPNSGESLGWLGRLADDTYDPAIDHVIADMGTSPSLAVRSGRHAPLVCDDPARLTRTTTDPALGFLRAPATNAVGSSDFVRQASATYRTPVDYGLGNAFGSDLRRVAASIAAKMPTRLYYVSYPGNAFDTHIQQADVHNRLLTYTADAVRAFMEDIARIGRADDVAVMMFTEFGRRVEENSSRGTDHGTATPMFIVGKHVKGGFYGRPPSLTDLDGGNSEDDDRLQERLRDDDRRVARLPRHAGGAERAVRAAERVRISDRGAVDNPSTPRRGPEVDQAD